MILSTEVRLYVQKVGKVLNMTKERGWVRTGIMAQFRFPDSPVYDSYYEITEEEANKIAIQK